MGYNVLRSHSPEAFVIALAIGLLLKSNTCQYILVIISFKMYEWALSTNILCVTILRQVQFVPYQHTHSFPLAKVSTYQDVISKQKCLYIFLNIYNYAHLSLWAHITRPVAAIPQICGVKGHQSNFKVTQGEKLTICLWFEYSRDPL